MVSGNFNPEFAKLIQDSSASDVLGSLDSTDEDWFQNV